MGIIISVVNAKGGVGKTTVTCNLAHALARKKQRVLVIDMDNQGDSTRRMAPPGTTLIKTLQEFLDPEKDAEQPPEAFIQPTLTDNLWYLANGDTSGIEPSMLQSGDFNGIRRLKGYVRDNFDYCLIDCPPNMGTFVLTAMLGSDFVIVPVLANSSNSIEGLDKALKLIERIQAHDNKELMFLRLLINQVDRRKAISRFNILTIHQRFDERKIFETTIPTNAPFETAEAQNTSIFQEAPSSSGCTAYRNLALEVMSLTKDYVAQPNG